MEREKFDPMKPALPPLISKFGDRMAARSRSRRWQDTVIDKSEAQLAHEQNVRNGMENDPDLETEFDDFLQQAEEDRGRSVGHYRSRISA